MRLRLIWLACLICFGCHSLTRSGREGARVGESAIPATTRSTAADQAPPSEERPNYLRLAAVCLEKGDDPGACEHLCRYLEQHPEHGNARYYHAELLMKLGRRQEALVEFEEAVGYSQDEPERDFRHLIHCHGRLLELGEALDDRYLVHLHRGIGLCLLAQQHAALDDPEGELSTEALLCKAAAELANARLLRPSEARPCWYLHVAWRELAQPRQATRWLERAGERATCCYLSPAEQRALQFALRAAVSLERP
jgi:tetratricopeptide (TPR) repeat protein